MNRHIALPILRVYRMVHAGRTHRQTKRIVHPLRDALAHLLPTTLPLLASCADRGNLLRHESNRENCRSAYVRDHRLVCPTTMGLVVTSMHRFHDHVRNPMR